MMTTKHNFNNRKDCQGGNG